MIDISKKIRFYIIIFHNIVTLNSNNHIFVILCVIMSNKYKLYEYLTV